MEVGRELLVNEQLLSARLFGEDEIPEQEFTAGAVKITQLWVAEKELK
jgi:hypothetical protein